jgi:hypothetical protein
MYLPPPTTQRQHTAQPKQALAEGAAVTAAVVVFSSSNSAAVEGKCVIAYYRQVLLMRVSLWAHIGELQVGACGGTDR